MQETTRSAPARAAGSSDERHRLAADRGGDALGPGQGAVGDDDPAGAALGDDAGGQRAHRTGADDEHVGAVERAEDLPGLVQADGDEGPAGAVDAGLGVGPLADPQGLLDQVVEQPAGAAGVLRGAQPDPDLAEDLALADDHRVQAAGHREQVRHGAVLVVHVEVRGELVEVDAGVPRQQLGDLGDAAVELVDVGVHLDPVAGGQHHRLGGVVAGEHVVAAAWRRRRRTARTRSSRSTGALRWDRPTTRTLMASPAPARRSRRRRRPGRPCAARGRPGSAARWTGRPCGPRRRPARRARSARSSGCC